MSGRRVLSVYTRPRSSFDELGFFMRAALQAVPGLFWLAAVWTVLSVWAEDVRGVYIAMFCVVIGTVQLFLSDK